MNESSWEKTALHFDLISGLVPLYFLWRIGAVLTVDCLYKRSVRRDENAEPLIILRIRALVLIANNNKNLSPYVESWVIINAQPLPLFRVFHNCRLVINVFKIT